MTTPRKRAAALLDEHGRTFADECGIRVGRGTPAVLWQLLVASTLLASRISHELAVRAAVAVRKDLPTAKRMTEAHRDVVVASLRRGHYLRVFRTAELLQDSAALVVSQYGGDLRRLRAEADGDLPRLTALLQELPGIGPVGVEIFLREVQVVWTELAPYAGERTLAQATVLHLPTDPHGLADLVDAADVPRLMAALVRSGLSS